jgi:hypothetical protein
VSTEESAAEARGAVLGREVVEFTRAANQLELGVVHSTLAVSGDRTGLVRENELVQGQSFSNAQQRLSAMLELVVQRQKQQLPFAVVRSGVLAGDSQTGEHESDGCLGRLIEAILDLKSGQAVRVARSAKPVYLVATDFVARAACHIGSSPSSAGGTFQLTEGHPRTAQHLLGLLLDKCGHKGSRVEGAVDRAFGAAHLSRMLSEVSSPRVFYGTERAERSLADSGLECPPLEDYAEKLVTFAREQRSR